MTVRISLAALATTALAVCSASAQDINPCDLEAGHPSDPNHVGPGKSSSQVVTQLAIPACRAAVKAQPDNGRFHYQLGRAIVYWADANGANYDEGMEHLKIAAGMRYTQALFVLGLMHQRHDDDCDAEPLYRQAAEQGLKAARVGYVNEVLAGSFAACEITVDKAAMRAFLEDAEAQMSGWYENMLLDGLNRELVSWRD
jgi:hypothetical protein